ncbi:purine-cytosine permease family protein [Pseudalkalibacillus sp. A8]|uniref:purine-cytosine permease family protein n=1 Tax=Pseudalkalibacillus sp. A8 TaxID=3382641 RepID=UPI0038B563E8
MRAERRFIEFIPEDERHGNPRSLFPMWFAVNLLLLTVVTGGLGVQAGLNLFWSLIGILLGNLVGGFFMATHSVQGPRLGVPQMIQSRAQFGVIGAVLPLVLVIIMYVGYGASNAVLAAQALSSETSISIEWGVVILSVISLVIAFYGHDLIHKVQRYLTILLGIIFIFVTVVAFQLDFPEGSWSPSQFELSAFLLVVGVSATWQLTYAPYIADYSRYLPQDTDSRKTFIYTYGGSVLSTTWMMTLGAILTVTLPQFLNNASLSLANLVGSGWAIIIFTAIILGSMGANVLNLYGAFMSITTVLETFVKLKSTIQTRFVLLLICSVISTALAVFGSANFMTNFLNLILLLSYTLFPWTTINLVDFFLLRHGNYNINALFDRNGEYGKYNWKALISYLIAVVCEIPFLNTTIYQGPIAKGLNGIDLAWIVALVVPGILYYYLMKEEIQVEFDSKSM